MTIDKDEMIAHFSAYGDVTGISMNPTRGYAFIDYRTNECVQIALRYVFCSPRATLRSSLLYMVCATFVNRFRVSFELRTRDHDHVGE